MHYVRRKDSDTFHFDEACSNYPTGEDVVVYDGVGDRPTYGELCVQCLAKEDKEDE